MIKGKINFDILIDVSQNKLVTFLKKRKRKLIL